MILANASRDEHSTKFGCGVLTFNIGNRSSISLPIPAGTYKYLSKLKKQED